MKIGGLFSIRGIQEVVGREPGQATEGRRLESLQLTAGQLVRGRVVDLLGQGKVLLNIEGRMLSAESHVAMQEGQELWLEVKGSGDKPWFALAGKKAAVREVLRLLLADTQSIGKSGRSLLNLADLPKDAVAPELNARLTELLGKFTDNAVGGRPEAEKIIRLLNWLGVGQSHGGGKRFSPQHFGRQLADILEGLVSSGSGRVAGPGGEFASLEKLAGLLETLHQLNSQPVSSDQDLFFLYPCFFSGAAGWGEWLVSLDREGLEDGRQQGSVVSLEFFLEMSRLGELHLQLSMHGKTLRGELALATDAARQHLQEQLPELTGALEGLGYQSVQIGCCLSTDSLLQKMKISLEEKARLRPDNLFHVTV